VGRPDRSGLRSQRCVAHHPGAGSATPFPLPEGRLVLEGLQQFLAAPLGRATAVGGDGHQHDGFAWLHPAHAVVHQCRQGAVVAGGVAGELLQLGFGHAGVVLQLQGLQRLAVRVAAPHPADEMAFGGWRFRQPKRQLVLPGRERGDWIEGVAVQRNLQVGRGHGRSGWLPPSWRRPAGSGSERRQGPAAAWIRRLHQIAQADQATTASTSYGVVGPGALELSSPPFVEHGQGATAD
jgi:hypothetical protein